jgi:hypothetical protein
VSLFLSAINASSTIETTASQLTGIQFLSVIFKIISCLSQGR